MSSVAPSASPDAAGDRLVAVDDVWVGEWTGPAVLRLRSGRVALLRSAADAGGGAVARAGGVVLPGFCDSHVHLGLVDAGALVAGGIARVVDLGWDPAVIAGWARGPAGAAGARVPDVDFAGAFLTGVGGYPSGRSWAPDAAVRQLADVADAVAAVTEMHRFGARFVKLVLHAGDGPQHRGDARAAADEMRREGGAGGGVNAAPGGAGDGRLGDDVAGAVVDEAHRLGLVVVAHAEGAGQAARAARLGVDRLAHTPWTERLDDDLITAMAERMTWVSTLDIHGWGEPTPEFAVALENLARFAAAGGHVLYGTDLGNGPLPTALNPRELDALVSAGLTAPQLLDALAPLPPSSRSAMPTSRDLGADAITLREVAPSVENSAATDTLRYLAKGGDAIELGARVSWVPTRAPSDRTALPTWLQTARVVAADDLEETRA
ncbi:amidohydrolase family protein [Herbiconiux sp. P16]|uniref:amidohydrolase n=1 Tax=Herbiconiux wuyangfengii TaxID=3342794 RepID=UPI0035BA51F1